MRMLVRRTMGRGFGRYSQLRLRRVAKWMDDPDTEQRRLLLDLTRTAARTRFGRDHDFGGIRSVADFQARVPLRTFAELEPYWRRLRSGEADVTWPGRIPLYAITSGSTGSAKLVPVSASGLSGFLRAGRDILCHYIAATGDTDLFCGKFLYLGGSRALAPSGDGTMLGDLSGIVAEETPRIYRPFCLPSPRVHAIADWEAKLEAVADEAWDADVRAVSGIPSWLLALFERVLARRRAMRLPAQTLADVWPNLSLIVHGGVNFAPYRPLFARLAGKAVRTLEIYLCSEGFLAIEDRPGSGDLLLRMDAGLFHEFVPVQCLGDPSPPRHWVSNVETGIDYAIAVSSASGLWGAYIGDTVRFESLRPHRLRFTGRTEQFLNAFGEHLSGADVESALVKACAISGADVVDFHVAPIYPTETSLQRGHEWFVEFARPPESPTGFVAALDAELRQRNVDYDEHRARNADLSAPALHAVPHGTFYAAMRRAGRVGGQHKVPHLHNDRRFADALLAAVPSVR
jgi:hypothetical protein